MSDLDEEDIAHAKGKERDEPIASSSSTHLDDMAYPPTTEDAEETRRVEENLRRWEIAERQRRKAARSSGSISSPPSLVSDVSRRASLLWSGRKSRHSSFGGLGNHSALRSQDTIDVLPLTQIDASPTPSPTRSESGETVDPFANPPESQSPFADSHVANTQGPSSSFEPEAFESHNVPLARPPPPKPLNLPPPRTPPPIINTHSPTSPSTPKFGNQNTPKEDNVRWWHDWLCGCGEGPDRGGDFQAGRTNPFE